MAKSWMRRIEDAWLTLSDLVRRAPTAAEEARAEQLRADLRSIGSQPFDAAQTPFWLETCAALLRCAEAGDPRGFMRWEPIAGTMVIRTTPHTIGAYRDLRAAAEWPELRRLIRRPAVGGAPPFLPAPWASAIGVQHASHLLNFTRATGADIAAAEGIIDFGAGYGGMCRLLRLRGYAGRYVIFDQPPVLALQRYFLACHGIDAAYGEFGAGGVALCSSVEAAAALLPAGRLSAISTWALSEMPLELRARIEPVLHRADKLLLAYQADFSGIDNGRYFTRLAAELGATVTPVPHLPQNHYVFRARAQAEAGRAAAA